MSETLDPQVARNWFFVRVEVERLGRWRKIGRSVVELLKLFLPFSGIWWDGEIKKASNVLVCRHDLGTAVTLHDYTHANQAFEHARSLESRLDSTHVFDFCRELGLNVAVVSGAGSGELGAARRYLPVLYLSRREIDQHRADPNSASAAELATT